MAVLRKSAMDPLQPNTSAMRLRTRPLAAGGRWVVLASNVDADGHGQQPGPPAQAGRGNDIAAPGRRREVTFTPRRRSNPPRAVGFLSKRVLI